MIRKEMTKMDWNMEYITTLLSLLLPPIGSYFILRYSWRRYGLLYIVSYITGILVCLFFVSVGFYRFPTVPLHFNLNVPFFSLFTVLPFVVLAGVRYSPKEWAYKIPFYWAIVHLLMFGETLAVKYLELLSYKRQWDFWDSYTSWWVYLLLFEYIGGLIVTDVLRRPIAKEQFRYGKPVWLIFHVIVISTIFLAGVKLGGYFRTDKVKVA
jgi:hypothetical protein